MGHGADSSSEHVGASIQADTTTIRNLVLAVLDDRRAYSVIDVCDLILERYGSIPFKNWKHHVKSILMNESERSESCIWSIRHKNEQVFGLVKNIEEWLLLRQHYRDMIKLNFQSDATIKDGLLKDFDPQNPRVPPGMSRGKARVIARGIASMNCDTVYYLNIDTLLEFPDTKKLNYARDMWNFFRYNTQLKEFISHIFRKLVNEDDVWANAVVEAICGIPLRYHIESAPLNECGKTFFTIPPGMNKRTAAFFILLLNFMKDAPHESRTSSALLIGNDSDGCKKRISLLRTLISYNPTLSQIIQPVLDHFSKSFTLWFLEKYP